MLSSKDVILFQGDSITDCGRNREKNTGHQGEALGRGYAFLTAARLLAQKPGLNLTFLNRGISGNKVLDLESRWQADCLDLKPTVVSILIGVNDTWHIRAGGGPAVPLDLYEKTYVKLIAQCRQTSPGVKMVLCEPFVFKCGAVKDDWFPEIDQRREIVARLAQAHGCRFAAFQAALNQAAQKHPQLEYWLGDGVHPTMAGHQVLADAWIAAVS